MRTASGKRLSPCRQNHALLNVDIVVRMGAAVQQVDQRNGHIEGIWAAQVGIERQPSVRGGGFRYCQGSTEYGIGAETRLVVGTIQVD